MTLPACMCVHVWTHMHTHIQVKQNFHKTIFIIIWARLSETSYYVFFCSYFLKC